MKLTDLCELRLRCIVSPVAPSTKDHYRRAVRMFSEFLEHQCTTADLTAENIIGFANHTVAQGNTQVTGNQRIKQLRAMWEWGARATNPVTGEAYVKSLPPRSLKIKCPKKNPQCWRPDELVKLFKACEQQTGWIGPHKASNWWLALHWWLYNTGERIEATFALRPSMVDLSLSMAEVPAEVRKGGMMPMQYVLSSRCVDALGVLLSRTEEYVFEGHWTHGSSFHSAYRRLVEVAGLPHVRHKSGPHKMRRTVASFISAMGGNASFFLGHAARNVAEESYIDRAFVMAHQSHLWPTDNLDPLSSREPAAEQLVAAVVAIEDESLAWL